MEFKQPGLVMVCRPNSRSIRPVCPGKGLDLAAAKTSGLMEAVEIYHAETVPHPSSSAVTASSAALTDSWMWPRSRVPRGARPA